MKFNNFKKRTDSEVNGMIFNLYRPKNINVSMLLCVLIFL